MGKLHIWEPKDTVRSKPAGPGRHSMLDTDGDGQADARRYLPIRCKCLLVWRLGRVGSG